MESADKQSAPAVDQPIQEKGATDDKSRKGPPCFRRGFDHKGLREERQRFWNEKQSIWEEHQRRLADLNVPFPPPGDRHMHHHNHHHAPPCSAYQARGYDSCGRDQQRYGPWTGPVQFGGCNPHWYGHPSHGSCAIRRTMCGTPIIDAENPFL